MSEGMTHDEIMAEIETERRAYDAGLAGDEQDAKALFDRLSKRSPQGRGYRSSFFAIDELLCGEGVAERNSRKAPA